MSKKIFDGVSVRLVFFVLVFLLSGFLTACNEQTQQQNPTPSTTSGDTTGGGSNQDTGGGSNTGGNPPPPPPQNLGTLSGTIDATLTTESYCSTSSSANAVYIYGGDTVIAVDISGANTDPIEVVQVAQDQGGTLSYTTSLDEGVYTIAFTCLADADQPTVAGDEVYFRGVTNVQVTANTDTKHDFSAATTSTGGLNATIQAMPANSWLEVPNSNMSQVEATDPEMDDIWQGNYQSADGVFAWSGGAFDTKRNNLIVWGGGHHDYYGNEIYTFNLTTLTWTRVNDPSIPTSNQSTCMPILPDGNPNSRHTYYNLVYITLADKFYTIPAGATSCGSGGIDPNTWWFDFDTKKWSNLNPTGTPIEGWAPSAAAYDPIDNKVYAQNPGGLYVHDLASNTWSHLNRYAYWDDYGAAVDTKRHLLVFVGGGKLVVYDIGNKDYTPQVWADNVATPPTSISEGSDFINQWYRPGVNYDPVADKIVVWDGGQVHALDMDTKKWTHLATAPQDHWYKGTYGRFRYSPIENAYVVVNSASQNVLIYKLTEGGGK